MRPLPNRQKTLMTKKADNSKKIDDSKKKDDHKSLLGSTAVIALITGISRVFGLVREQEKATLL